MGRRGLASLHPLTILCMLWAIYFAEGLTLNKLRGSMAAELRYARHDNETVARQHDLQRRELLGAAHTPLYGSVLLNGYYYALVNLGTPPQEFELIVDTGSTVTYVPCSDCASCGVHQDPRFRFAQSSTYVNVSCHDPLCESRSCTNDQLCPYSRHYAEESTSAGILGSDIITFRGQNELGSPRVVFGCELKETGDLYSQQADGILGLGKGPMAVVTQLEGKGVMDNVFSLCYSGMGSGDGAMIIGTSDIPSGMAFTPYDPARPNSPYYVIVIQSLLVDGTPVDLPLGSFGQGPYGNVLDSGTTFTYLPPRVFTAFKAQLMQQLDLPEVAGPDPQYHDTCFGGASTDTSQIGASFPTLQFILGGGATLPLTPENYLFAHRLVPGAYCLGMFPNSEMGTLIGGITVRNTLVRYDRANGRIGFAKTDCGRLLATSTETEEPMLPAPPAPTTLAATPRPLSPSTSPTQVTTALPLPATLPPTTPPALPQPPPPTTRPASAATTTPASAATTTPAPSRTTEAAVVTPSPATTTPSQSPNPAPGGGVTQVVAELRLQTDYASFSSKLSVFITTLASQLQVAPGQVKVLSYREGSVIVSLAIVPTEDGGGTLPDTAAARIVGRLQRHEVELEQGTFGTYEVESVEAVRAGEEESGGSTTLWVVVVVTLFGGVSLLIFAGVVGYKLWQTRRQYKSLSVDDVGERPEDDLELANMGDTEMDALNN